MSTNTYTTFDTHEFDSDEFKDNIRRIITDEDGTEIPMGWGHYPSWNKGITGVESHCYGKNNGMYGKTHTPEAIVKIIERNRIHREKYGHSFLGKIHSEETKKKMSESKMGEKNPWFGKKHSPETIEKMRKAALNRGRNLE